MLLWEDLKYLIFRTPFTLTSSLCVGVWDSQDTSFCCQQVFGFQTSGNDNLDIDDIGSYFTRIRVLPHTNLYKLKATVIALDKLTI